MRLGLPVMGGRYTVTRLFCCTRLHRHAPGVPVPRLCALITEDLRRLSDGPEVPESYDVELVTAWGFTFRSFLGGEYLNGIVEQDVAFDASQDAPPPFVTGEIKVTTELHLVVEPTGEAHFVDAAQ